MSLKEAKEVTASFNHSNFIPPPRRINDITDILSQEKQDQQAVKRLVAKAEATPPEGAGKEALREFYFERGMAAKKLGRLTQSIEDFRLAVGFIDDNLHVTPSIISMYKELALTEMFFNNFRAGIETIERIPRVSQGKILSDLFLIRCYVAIGDLEGADKAMKRMMYITDEWRGGRFDILKRYLRYTIAAGNAAILDAQARYQEAGPYHQEAVRAAMDHAIKSDWPREPNWARTVLAENLMHQGYLIQAEIEGRTALLEAQELFGNKSLETFRNLEVLARILSKQGRHRDSEQLLRTLIRIMVAAGASVESLGVGFPTFRLGEVLQEQEDWAGALTQFRQSERSLGKNPAIIKKYFSGKAALPLTLLRTGHPEEALVLLQKSYQTTKNNFGADNYRTLEIMGLLAVALADTGRTPEALDFYSRAVPSLLERRTGSEQQTKLVLERYIDLLAGIRGTDLEKEAGIDSITEAFRIAEAAGSRSVQSALTQSVTRTALNNPELSDFARREQDSQKQIEALESLLSEHLNTPVDQQTPEVMADLRERVARLRKAQRVLRSQIEEKFSRYSELLNPPPSTVDKVQEHLRHGEVLISIYPSEKRTYVWAVPKKGRIQFAVAPLSEIDIQKCITHLRNALNPEPKTLGDIPEFDITLAYDFYSKLLKPVEEGWNDAEDLLIVAPGPLGQLPFSVLPTESVKLGKEKRELFANYRKVPWLIRKVSITRLPSVSSFVTLRTTPEGDPSRKAFAGFGDPLFNQAQLAKADSEMGDHIVASTAQSIHVRVRGMRLTDMGNLDSEKISSITLGNLNRLHDTAEEIKSIANALGADPDRDIFLGKRASERLVKIMDLSDRKIIAFASHALVPGDLDGLDQPAIALSAPSVTGDKEDGLLTMGEILKLKLNADWVVLSACNTGAADGAGAEAVSGLGRAFFYAGTRALLASMWPVETTSAKKLTTGLFQYQKEDKTITRARALQKSMLELIDHQVLKDDATGKIIASFAHPLFWAPFIVVGDGG
ncbi:CHAT domain-containing protein [Thermodesulfobacteriota bacterium]